MSDEKRREELKAKINEELDGLSTEDLESIAGGGIIYNLFLRKRQYCKRCKVYFPVGSSLELCPYCGAELDLKDGS
jgi:hypothetical protein